MFTRKLEAIQAHHIPTHIRHQIINKHNIIEIQLAVQDVDEEEYQLVFSAIELTLGRCRQGGPVTAAMMTRATRVTKV